LGKNVVDMNNDFHLMKCSHGCILLSPAFD